MGKLSTFIKLKLIKPFKKRDGYNFLGLEIPILKSDGSIYPTRIGVNANDKNTPFVEYSFEKLYCYYPSYQRTEPFSNCASYADIILLKQGELGFKDGQDVEEIEFSFRGRYKLPFLLCKHGEAAVELFKNIGKVRRNINNEWENDPSMRIRSWSRSKVEFQTADYFHQIATNLTIDWDSGFLGDQGRTIRTYIEPYKENKLPLLEDSHLANTVGIATYLLTKEPNGERKLFTPIRGSEVAIMANGEGKFHCSVSGVFEFEYDGSSKISFDIFLEGMKKEISDELNISHDHYQLIPLAFARELARGGKPQLFFLALCDLCKQEIQEKMKKATERWEFIQPERLPSNSLLLKWLNTSQEDIFSEVDKLENYFTYEGIAAYWLVQKYLQQFPID